MNILLLPCETMSNGATSKLPSGISSPCQRQQREWRNLRLLLSRPRENVVVSSTRAIVGSNSSSSSSSSSSSCLRREPRVRREAVCGTDMHTNDNDSSTLVTSPWQLGSLGGEAKARFPSSEPQQRWWRRRRPRRGKGKGTNAKRWPSRMRATRRKLYYRRPCIKIHRKRDCPRLVVDEV